MDQGVREKREKGLCFHCDEKYTAGYKCKNQMMFQLINREPKEEGG